MVGTLIFHFGIIKLAGAPFSLQKGGLWTPFGALSPLFEGKRVSHGFFQKKCSQKLQKRDPAESYNTKNTNRITQPASAGTIPIQARRPILGWLTTLEKTYIAARGLEELFSDVLERFLEPVYALHVDCKN